MFNGFRAFDENDGNNDDDGDNGDVSPDYLMIDAGAGLTCAIDEANKLECWGDDEHGQVSDRPDGDYVEASVGGGHACAITEGDGVIYCWGRDDAGQSTAP